jgi:nucleotidyltransferase-like protein
MHIYAFGSLVRGEVSLGSDVDLLAIVEGIDNRFDPDVFSIYSYRRIKELWQEGNPFAWHLSLESVLVFASTGHDFLTEMGKPHRYTRCADDCEKFYALFKQASRAITEGTNSLTFNLSIVFLSIRNFATCFSLGLTSRPNFSRTSAFALGGDSIMLSRTSFEVFERARILSTRGVGPNISAPEAKLALAELNEIEFWMKKLLGKVSNYA